MIKKLICKIWGCKITNDVFTGRYGEVFDGVWGVIPVPVMRKERLDFCTRCGKDHR